MTNTDSQLARLAIISDLVGKAPGLGRTALMKCLFFLKTLKNVPLPYSFRLYTYGPFDADVLDDLQYAESVGAIESTVAHYPGGYAYEFRPGPKAEEIKQRASEFISQYRDSIDWVVEKFGDRSAVDLEMASTLVYVDRALAEEGNRASIPVLAKKVRDIKPHLAEEEIEREALSMKDHGLLIAVG